MLTLPVALQLFTVRDFLEKDLGGTLQRVKTIGYDYVEPAGLYGIDVKSFKAALDAAGLKAVCAHVPYDELCGDTAAVVDNYIYLGCKYIAIPYLGGGNRPGDDTYDETLKKIDEIGAIAAEKGVKLLYHNHDFEFVKMPDGSFGLDYMYSHICPCHLATELDTCWVKVAGQCPAAYIRKYAGRCPVVHLKDFVGSKTENMYELIGTSEAKAEKSEKFEFRPVGSGVQDFPAILAAARESGADYVVVEQDMSYGMTSLESAKASRDYLRSLGW